MPIIIVGVPGQCSVFGNLSTLLGGNAAFGSIDFVLGNLGTGTVPRVINVGIFPALKQTVQADENGNVACALWGNDKIDPGNTVYFLTFRDAQRNEVGQVTFSITGTNFDLNTATAANTILPPIMVQVGNINRIFPVLGTALTAADFAISGWGTGATITNVEGTDTACQLTVTAGTTPSISPTITLTYHDGAWPKNPMVMSQMVGGSGAVSDFVNSTTTTQAVLTYDGLPVATKTYTVMLLSLGRP
jgi:hypothetical protein